MKMNASMLRKLIKEVSSQSYDPYQDLYDAGALIEEAISKMKTALHFSQQNGTFDNEVSHGVKYFIKHLEEERIVYSLKSNKLPQLMSWYANVSSEAATFVYVGSSPSHDSQRCHSLEARPLLGKKDHVDSISTDSSKRVNCITVHG